MYVWIYNDSKEPYPGPVDLQKLDNAQTINDITRGTLKKDGKSIQLERIPVRSQKKWANRQWVYAQTGDSYPLPVDLEKLTNTQTKGKITQATLADNPNIKLELIPRDVQRHRKKKAEKEQFSFTTSIFSFHTIPLGSENPISSAQANQQDSPTTANLPPEASDTAESQDFYLVSEKEAMAFVNSIFQDPAAESSLIIDSHPAYSSVSGLSAAPTEVLFKPLSPKKGQKRSHPDDEIKNFLPGAKR